MDSFGQMLFELKSTSNSKREQGSRFERLMKQYFMINSLYAQIYEKVWLWNDFPYNGGKPDTGIDLVAKVRESENEYCAIQCKFYDENNAIQKADVDTFLSASGKPFMVDGKPVYFSSRIIVSTTDKWSSNAEDTIIGQIPPVNRLRLKDLKDSDIDWDSFSLSNIEDMKKADKKILYPHQQRAVNDVLEKLANNDRGKLIMACGTGKTFTSLKISEAITNGYGNILFLVPSISLLNQTLIEWSSQCKYSFKVYAICSDPKASKINETSDIMIDTVIPATTNVDKLLYSYSLGKKDSGLQLFFSTYQSIDVIAEFQKISGAIFDIAICDEAHRTTGVKLVDEDESNFIKVHNNEFVIARKRLYMTATPRIYGDESKTKANTNNALLCSMDDVEVYGEDIHFLGFSQAVEQGLLSDYKVIVLAVDENYVSRSLQRLLTDRESELNLDDSIKIVGCLNGLAKKTIFEGEEDYFANDPQPMKRAVAFCSNIAGSKKFVQMFKEIQDEYKIKGYDANALNVELEHVDGTNNALFRKQRIDWLKESTADKHCRVLSNARCLSEGIDVPALDAVMFLNPRNSIVDIIQSVGRVMRKSDGKKYGYIILPVGIPAGVEPEDALNDNKKYKIVWDVLQALRAHDDRFNNTINKIELNHKKPNNIQIIGVTGSVDEENAEIVKGESYTQISLNLDDLQKWKNSIYAKIVKKCGSRRYWETWAKDIAEIADRHINEIRVLLEIPEISEKFDVFLDGLRQNLNPSIDRDDAIEMLAEHLITKPVFDALFENYEFIKSNPVSVIMQDMLVVLNEKALDKEQETLDKFYLSVQEKAKGIDNAEGKQKIIIELYEQFFKNALPKQVEKLGIVYTPIEVVDFIIQSIDYVLRQKFECSLSDKGVHVLDPFTGTGTFIVRLLRSGLIKPNDLLYKYTSELHANEIVLLAYYIAAVNIEETFHDLSGNDNYVPFEGIVLTDTFELAEHNANRDGETDNSMFYQNADRAVKQAKSPIKVIIGNPPYSVGQKNGNDNNQNVSYDNLDSAIAHTYVENSKAALNRNAYDTYIKAFRWATDRISENGVIGFVTNGAYIDSTSLDGFRKCLLEDFNSIYCFNLRGNQRTSGELSRKEGGKIFGSGSRTPVTITILIKKKGAKRDNYVHYYDIGDYLTREQKLSIIKDFSSIKNIHWKTLIPDVNNDWLNLRNPNFINFIALGDKKRRENGSYFLDNYSMGMSTNRDVWIYNFNCNASNAKNMIAFYNSEVDRCFEEYKKLQREGKFGNDTKVQQTVLANLRSNDATKISWSSGLFSSFCKGLKIVAAEDVRMVMYRPFCKKYCFYDKQIIERPSKWDSIFPDETFENLVICVSGAPIKKTFSVLITNCIQDLHLLENSQSFPLYMYDREVKKGTGQMNMFGSVDVDTELYKKRFALSDLILKKYQDMYGSKVSKEDIFYYLYAVLQNKTYIDLYGDNLGKEMPRIPFLNKFPEYVKIGKTLASLHLHYEKLVLPEDIGVTVEVKRPDYRVKQMRFQKNGKVANRNVIIFNDSITITNISDRAYEYIINGKPAVEWLMEQYALTIDKASGIMNDPNDYKDDKYVFNLLLSVIDVSIKTCDLVDSMPEYQEI